MKLIVIALLAAAGSLGSAKIKAETFDLTGIYLVHLKVNDHVFEDVLDLKGTTGVIPLFGIAELAGTMTVPGAFTAALDWGSSRCGVWSEQCFLQFQITAVENGRKYKVQYTAVLSDLGYRAVLDGKPAVLEGRANFENGDLLGTFTATQQRTQ